MERTQFTFYESFYKAASRIRKAADRAAAYDAIIAYALYGTEPDVDNMPDAAAIAFEIAKPNLDASRRKAASGKKGGERKQTRSKPGANASKPEANPKQVKEQEQVKEQDKDKEQMLYPPLPPSGGNPPEPEQPEVDLSGLSPAMQAKLNQWLAYKKERRESYKPTGLQALVTRIRTSAEKYGEYAVCEVIDSSMASGYQGILFDRLQQQSGNRGRKEPIPSWVMGSQEQEAIKRMMATAGNDPEIAERAEKLKQELSGM